MINPHPLKIYLMMIKLSQTELAKRANMDRSKINLFLNGRLILDKDEANKLYRAVGFDSLEELDSAIKRITKKD